EELKRLHPILLQRREDMIHSWSRWLDEPHGPGHHPIMAAQSDLRNAIEAAVVGLEDTSRRFLILARATLKEVFCSGVQPYLGANPILCLKYNDDTDLDRHWAIAYKTRYLIGLLLDRGDPVDLTEALSHMKSLVTKTNDMSGHIKTSRMEII